MGGLDYIYHEVEKPLIPILHEAMWYGVGIDPQVLVDLEAGIKDEIEGYRVRYSPLNLNSGQQVGRLLYEEWQLPKRRTKTGWKTDAETLKELLPLATGEAATFLTDILTYRKLRDEVVKFCTRLHKFTTSDLRIRGSIMQNGTDTGRMSMHDPNLMNIPHRTEMGKRLRRCFVPTDGYVLLEADLSQIELRVEGVLTGDPYFITPYTTEGGDLHRQTQEALGEYSLDRVGAKTVNFGVIYEAEAKTLAQSIGCPVHVAQALLDDFWSKIQPTAEYIQRTRYEVARQGYAETWFGRRRYVKLDDRMWMRKKQLREAVNMPTQGTAADIFKLLTPYWHRVAHKYNARLLLPIHDAWLVECPPQCVEELAGEMRHIVQTFLPEFPLPLDCEVKVGMNWTDMEVVK